MENMNEKDWKIKLSKEQYEVCRNKGTELPFIGKYVDCKEEGIYTCSCCGSELFKSDDKFDSGTGWPSFQRAINNNNIQENNDSSLGMNRIEVTCKNCGSHLGHLFNDGPTNTGKRYCINSISLNMKKK